jgi:erythromycin esterase-like protein
VARTVTIAVKRPVRLDAARLRRVVSRPSKLAPVAQLDRVSASEAEGRAFESRRAHQIHRSESRGMAVANCSTVERATSKKSAFDSAAAALNAGGLAPAAPKGRGAQRRVIAPGYICNKHVRRRCR